MVGTDTKERIVRKLRGTDAPALSASQLADDLDVSVRTIHNHVDDLNEQDRIASTQIGNATAFYIPFEELPAHRKPDHTCARCGREVDEGYDFAKIEASTYFERSNLEPPASGLFVFCRFCYSDFIGWVMDPGTIGDYSGVHSWSIPDEQLEEVQEDPDIISNPGDPEFLDDEPTHLFNFVKEREGDDGVQKDEILQVGQEEYGMLPVVANQAINTLIQTGYIYLDDPFMDSYKTAK